MCWIATTTRLLDCSDQVLNQINRFPMKGDDKIQMKGGKKMVTRKDFNSVDERKECEPNQKENLSELFNFSCVLRGEVKHIEKIKEYIAQEYVDNGLIKLLKPTYDKKEIYIVTDDEWKEYQKLKKRDDRLIGPGVY